MALTYYVLSSLPVEFGLSSEKLTLLRDRPADSKKSMFAAADLQIRPKW
jgi:hypothetical protein